MKRNNIQSESTLREHGSTNAVMKRGLGAAQSEVSRDFARFPVFAVGTLVENLFVCGVLSLSRHGTPHTTGPKRFNIGLFVLMFVVFWCVPSITKQEKTEEGNMIDHDVTRYVKMALCH